MDYLDYWSSVTMWRKTLGLSVENPKEKMSET